METEDNFEEYEMSEKDISWVIEFIKIQDPENATRENAILFLERYKTRFHELGHVLTDEQMHELYVKFAEMELEG